MGLSVEPAEIMPPDPERPVHAVACRVLVVVGMGRSHEGKPQLAGGLEPGETQGELGCHMHDVGPEPGSILDHIAEPGKGPLHVGIKEERHTGRPVYLGPVLLAFG